MYSSAIIKINKFLLGVIFIIFLATIPLGWSLQNFLVAGFLFSVLIIVYSLDNEMEGGSNET